jgi:hypothetical protein
MVYLTSVYGLRSTVCGRLSSSQLKDMLEFNKELVIFRSVERVSKGMTFVRWGGMGAKNATLGGKEVIFLGICAYKPISLYIYTYINPSISLHINPSIHLYPYKPHLYISLSIHINPSPQHLSKAELLQGKLRVCYVCVVHSTYI